MIENENLQVRRKQGIDFSSVIDRDKIEEIEDILKCKICFQLMINPYDCESCEQSFCYDCIMTLFEKGKSCPESCKKSKIKQSSSGIKNLLQSLFLKCDNKECSEEISYSDYFQHLKECPFSVVICPNSKCSGSFLRSEIEKHLDTCEYSFQKCEKCCLEYSKAEYDNHLNLCKEIFEKMKLNIKFEKDNGTKFSDNLCLTLAKSYSNFEIKLEEISKENNELKKLLIENIVKMNEKLDIKIPSKSKENFQILFKTSFDFQIDPKLNDIAQNSEINSIKNPSVSNSVTKGKIENYDFPLKSAKIGISVNDNDILKYSSKKENSKGIKNSDSMKLKSENRAEKNSSGLDKKFTNLQMSQTFDPEKKSMNESFDFSINNVVSLNEKVDKLFDMMQVIINNNIQLNTNLAMQHLNANLLNSEQRSTIGSKTKENTFTQPSKQNSSNQPVKEKPMTIGTKYKPEIKKEGNQGKSNANTFGKQTSRVTTIQHTRDNSLNKKVTTSKERRDKSNSSRDLRNDNRPYAPGNSFTSSERLKTNELINLCNKIMDKLFTLEQNLNFDELNNNLQNIGICLRESIKQAMTEMTRFNSENRQTQISDNFGEINDNLFRSDFSDNGFLRKIQDIIENILNEKYFSSKTQIRDIIENFFIEKSGLVKCGIESCGKVNFLLMSKKCEQCESLFCRDCGIQCMKCSKILCEKCTVCPRSQDNFCKNCKKKCESCVLFRDCHEEICDNCLKGCKFCQVSTCLECIKDCFDCDLPFCMKCGKCCTVCGKASCNKCGQDKDYENCRICCSDTCVGCIETCINCKNTCCKGCIISCQKCSKQTCKSCSVTCISCKNGYDEICAKTNFQIKCFKCEKSYCTSCTKQNTQKCKNCGQNFCKKCSIQCQKCKNCVCLLDCVQCQNCKINFCKRCLEKCPCFNVLFCEICKGKNETVYPHSCVYWLNSTPFFNGFKSRSLKAVPKNFEAKIFLEKLTSDLSIGLTDNANIVENSLILYDNIWCLKVKSGMKYSSENSLESYLKFGGRDLDSIYITYTAGNLSFRVNDGESNIAYILDSNKEYYLYVENDTQNSESKINIVYFRIKN